MHAPSKREAFFRKGELKKNKIFPKISFLKNPNMSLQYTREAATLCKKVEKSYERILKSRSNERTDKQTDESEFIGPKSDHLRG